MSVWQDDDNTATYVYGTDANGDTMKYTGYFGGIVYVMKDSNNKVVAVEKDNEGNYAKATDTYNKVAPYFSKWMEWNSSYGAEGFFSDLVASAQRNVNKDFSGYKENGNLYFSFGYHEHDDGEEPLTFWKVDVVANASDAELANLKVTIVQYSGSGKYTYDSSTDTCTLTDGATASQTDTYTITQTAGDRTYQNEVDLKSFEFTSISFKDSNGNVVSESSPLNMDTGGFIELSVEFGPNTANIEFDVPTTSYTGPEEGIFVSFSKNYSSGGYTLSIDAYKAGDYVVTVKTANCEEKFAIKVTEKIVNPVYMAIRRYVESGVYDANYGSYDSAKMLDGDTFTTHIDVSNYFVPFFQPYDASKGIDVTVLDSDGVAVDKDDYCLNTESSIYSRDEDYEQSAIEISFDNEGTYTLKLASSVDATYSQTYTVNVESDDFRTVLSKSGYMILANGTYGNGSYSFVFSPSDTDEMSGTVTITDRGYSDSASGLAYTISKADGENYYEISVEDNNCWWGDLFIGADYNLYATTPSNNNLYKLYEYGTMGIMMPKTWYGNDTDDSGYCVDYLRFYNDGTVHGSISEPDSEDDYLLDCEYTIRKNANDDNYTVVFSFDGYLEDTNNDWFEDMPVTATLSGDCDLSTSTLEFNASYLEVSFSLTHE